MAVGSVDLGFVCASLMELSLQLHSFFFIRNQPYGG